MRWLLIAVGLVLAIALATSAPSLSGLASRGDADAVPTLTVSRGDLIESTVALGTVQPQIGAEVRVGSQLSGVVERLEVGVGDPVRAGDRLVVLRSDERRAAVAALAAELVAAEAERDFAAGELARAEQLRELLTQAEIERAARSARVRDADVERLRARLSEAQIALGFTEIRAPISGTVASVSTQVGETVAASFAAPTFVTIVDLDRLEVQAYVDETDIGRVVVGQAVAVRVDAFPGRELPGVVRAVRPKAEILNNVVNYVVIIDLTSIEGLLVRPEMTVHVSFELERSEDVVRVPRSALFEEAGRAWVVVEEAGGWRERDVVTGLRTAQEVEIRSGLAAGETVVAERRAWNERRGKEESR